MSQNRNPNTNCVVCKKAIYRRPWEIKKYKNSYCGSQCMFKNRLLPEISCKECGNLFRQKKKIQKFCSKSCVGKSTRNRLGTKNGFKSYKNSREKRLQMLRVAFNFTSCMVDGCSYNTVYNIHRFIHGADGGEYEIGNMFAICPNHHAEHHCGLIEFYKKNDFTLIIKK